MKYRQSGALIERRAEANKTVYQEDGSTFRHIDSLMWSRFQTISAIEGALLYFVLFSNAESDRHKIASIIVASLLICLISLLTLMDRIYMQPYLERMATYESSYNFKKIEQKFITRSVWPVVFLIGLIILLANAWLGLELYCKLVAK